MIDITIEDINKEMEEHFNQHLFKVSMLSDLTDRKDVQLMLRGMYMAGRADAMTEAIRQFHKQTHDKFR